jgi:hypothetical protein
MLQKTCMRHPKIIPTTNHRQRLRQSEFLRPRLADIRCSLNGAVPDVNGGSYPR